MLVIGDENITELLASSPNKAFYVESCWCQMLTEVESKLQSLNNIGEDKQLRLLLSRFNQNVGSQTHCYQAFFHRLLSGRGACNGKRLSTLQRSKRIRRFSTWYQLALMLDGQIVSKGAFKKELVLGKRSVENLYVSLLINLVLGKIHNKITQIRQQDTSLHNAIIMELLSGQTIIRANTLERKLQPAHEIGRLVRMVCRESESNNGNVDNNTKYLSALDVLKSPFQFELPEKLATLLDLFDYFGEQSPGHPETAGQWQLSRLPLSTISVSVLSENGIEQHPLDELFPLRAKVNKSVLGEVGQAVNRDEEALSTLTARQLGIPVSSGHSMYAAKVFHIAKWVGCSKHELTALAHSFLTLWHSPVVRKTSFRLSTLHEIFDIAKNFGVRYELNFDAKTEAVNPEFDSISADYLMQYIRELNTTIKTLHEQSRQNLQAIENHASEAIANDESGFRLLWRSRLEEKAQYVEKLTQLIGQKLYAENGGEMSSSLADSVVSINGAPDNLLAGKLANLQELLLKLCQAQDVAQKLMLLTRQQLQIRN